MELAVWEFLKIKGNNQYLNFLDKYKEYAYAKIISSTQLLLMVEETLEQYFIEININDILTNQVEYVIIEKWEFLNYTLWIRMSLWGSVSVCQKQLDTAIERSKRFEEGYNFIIND